MSWVIDKHITVFENHRKSLIQHCERSELRLQKFSKNAKKVNFASFKSLKFAVKQSYQKGWKVQMRHFEEFSNNVSIRTFIAKISMTIWGLPLISPTQDFGNRIWNQSLTIITSPSTMLKTVLVARGPRTPKGPCALQRCWSWKMVDKKLDVRLSLLGLTAGHKKG